MLKWQLPTLHERNFGEPAQTVVVGRALSRPYENFRGYTFQAEPLKKLPTCLDDLLIDEKSIANGCEGAVYKAMIKADVVLPREREGSSQSCRGYDLALKAVFNYSAESNAHSILSEMQREVVPLRPEGCRLDTPLSERVGRLPPHPNIVDMPGMFVDDMLVTEEGLKKFPAAMPHKLDPEHCYGRNKTLYLVMRKRSSHLRDFLSKEAANQPVTMATRCQILAQLLEGVAHLGEHGVAHRDLKADNILVDMPKGGGCPRIEICDFGCCLAEQDQLLKIPYPTRDMYLGGNSRLMAPEIITATPGPDSILDYSKSDLWAVGALAYEILGADNPFYPNNDNFHQPLNARNYKEEDLPALPGDVPEPVHQLVQKLLSREPRKRPNASVAVAVAQMAALSLSSVRSPLHNSTPLSVSTKQQGRQLRGGKVHKGQGAQKRLPQQDLCHKTSKTTAASYRHWSNRKREWLNWILALGLAMVCQLTFSDQAKLWDMPSVMSFLFLSRLTYADFQEAMTYF
ncbi:serine/threonine-protein kinase PINK1 [Elysia marginata]|uniref:non-specific serine/threonine protein kinase n=1 Tax=Elysia marginata TaxID=1093978 RepID=A0AAV4HCZ6_9GAST|nr:serine/threonine-protein kinase PINK1 [Elysia marginata]